MFLAFYFLSFLGLWHKLKPGIGWLFAAAYSYTIIFSLVIVNVVISQLLTGGISHILVASLTLSVSAIFVFKSRQNIDETNTPSPYTIAVASILCLIVVYVYGFNAVRFYEQRGSIPIVGTNDDNANHMALATVSIKDQSMIMSSKLLQKMVDDTTVLPSTKWYPFGLYTNMHVGYVLFKSVLGIPERFELRSFFSFNTIFTVGLLLNLLILIYALVDRIYKIRTIHTFALSLTIGFMVILGEFFVKLQVYGFHSQLAGYCAFIALLLALDTAGKEKRLSLASLLLICLFIIAVGTTYYLFIPIAGFAYFTFHSSNFKDKSRLIPYVALAASCIPLLIFNSIYSIKAQSSSYGIAFVQFSGLMTASLGILLGVLMRNGINQNLRKMLIFQFGLSIAMMIIATVAMYSDTGNFGYYFFKSYWTMGILGLPLLVAFVGYIGDLFVNKNLAIRTAVTIVMVIIAGGIFYGVFSQPGYDSRNYDFLMMIHNGNYNYPFDQKKWIKIYEKYKDSNGSNIYSVGLWGQGVLSRALYEGSPTIMRQLGGANEVRQSELIYKDISQKISEKKRVVLLDNLYRIQFFGPKTKTTKEFEEFIKSPFLE